MQELSCMVGSIPHQLSLSTISDHSALATPHCWKFWPIPQSIGNHLQHPCKKDGVETAMCHPDLLSELNDLFPCCTAASKRPSAMSSLENDLGWRFSSHKLLLPSQGSPHPKTGWHAEYKDLALSPQLETMVNSHRASELPTGSDLH